MEKYCLSDFIDLMYKPENCVKTSRIVKRRAKGVEGRHYTTETKKMELGKKSWKDKWVPTSLQKQLELWE